MLGPWTKLQGLPHAPLTGGLINDTFVVGDPPVAVVQRQHRVFSGEVNLDIDAITSHIESRGLITPRLIRTREGELWHTDDEGAAWRALTWVPGQTVDRLTDPKLAAEAGRLVGRWHAATADLEHKFHFTRPGAHDTPLHMSRLEAAIDLHRGHPLRDDVARLAEDIQGGWSAWAGTMDLPERIAHGDLKISNLRFTEEGRGCCLLDLDTMAYLPLAVELGDAWRSWCNPLGEDVASTEFRIDLFEAAAAGYLPENPVPSDEREQLVLGVERICLELAARFAADALHESYFGWNEDVAPTRGDHNLLRARGQASLAASVARQRDDLLHILGI
jgi:Ser/Thr protein kinase RdoA (MazF antagonist)